MSTCVKLVGLCVLALFCPSTIRGIKSAAAPALPVLNITVTSHYELGEKIGIKFHEEINAAMSADPSFKKVLTYNLSESGAAVFNSLLSAAQQLPQYIDEIKGMAKGAKVGFSELFLWNVRYEMEMLGDNQNTPVSSCTDLYIKTRDPLYRTLMAHNEDGRTFFMSTVYWVNAVIMSKDGHMPLESFSAFCYPGELCGRAFGFNPSIGLVTTINSLFPKSFNASAIGQTFLTRAVIALPYDQILNFLKQHPCAIGFSLNMGDLNSKRLSNIEISPNSVVQTVYQDGFTGYHFNMYLHSKVEQRNDTSSVHRENRLKDIKPPSTFSELRDILGDTGDKEYPIFRTATPPDQSATLASCMFDFHSKQLYLYRGNPALQPSISIIPLQ